MDPLPKIPNKTLWKFSSTKPNFEGDQESENEMERVTEWNRRILWCKRKTKNESIKRDMCAVTTFGYSRKHISTGNDSDLLNLSYAHKYVTNQQKYISKRSKPVTAYKSKAHKRPCFQYLIKEPKWWSTPNWLIFFSFYFHWNVSLLILYIVRSLVLLSMFGIDWFIRSMRVLAIRNYH